MVKPKAADRTGHLWVEEGIAREGAIAEVAPVLPMHRTYSFGVPEEMEASVSIGQRVAVPIGRKGRLVPGFVVGLDRGTWDSTLRPIAELIDPLSFLTPDLVELGREIACHYACPLGRCLKAMTPEAVRRQSGLKTVRYVRLKRDPAGLFDGKTRMSERRRAAVEILAASDEPVSISDLTHTTGVSPSVIRAMAKVGWVEVFARKEIGAAPDATSKLEDPDFELNDEQRNALDDIRLAIDAGKFSATLLFGVSGSGKTEVYIHAIREVLDAGRQAILLVPEIVLTTQLVQRLAVRFRQVAVNHSGLTGTQRSIIWRQVGAGEKTVVIGTRSAVFAPCPNLGLICVDEEQETSYKNLQTPRFNVRDVAIMRAKQLNIPVVMGSATPLLETWYHSGHRSDYHRVFLRNRVKALPMPKVHIVDMREEHAERKGHVIFSRLMEKLLSATLDRGEQAMLLMNRRGFAHYVFCPACRTRLACPHCNVGMVVHSTSGESICHYCRYRGPTPKVCPNVSCGECLVQRGTGTQRIEEFLAARFPDARVYRVDSDTMTHRDKYQRVVEAFQSREIDVLVGTQMIAKGLDFPFVSFVGVVSADMNVLAGDFRGHERLFQLITQVAGRAGRADATGQVVVQTETPDLPALQHALRHDYETFAAEELRDRQCVGLPPFRRLARFVLAHDRDSTARDEAAALADRIRAKITQLALDHSDVLGPSPCMLSRLRGRYRYDILVRAASASALRELMGAIVQSGDTRTKTQSLIIDVDPVTMT
jgi:primosomal protein N' (replication factor Y)